MEPKDKIVKNKIEERNMKRLYKNILKNKNLSVVYHDKFITLEPLYYKLDVATYGRVKDLNTKNLPSVIILSNISMKFKNNKKEILNNYKTNFNKLLEDLMINNEQICYISYNFYLEVEFNYEKTSLLNAKDFFREIMNNGYSFIFEDDGIVYEIKDFYSTSFFRSTDSLIFYFPLKFELPVNYYIYFL